MACAWACALCRGAQTSSLQAQCRHRGSRSSAAHPSSAAAGRQVRQRAAPAQRLRTSCALQRVQGRCQGSPRAAAGGGGGGAGSPLPRAALVRARLCVCGGRVWRLRQPTRALFAGRVWARTLRRRRRTARAPGPCLRCRLPSMTRWRRRSLDASGWWRRALARARRECPPTGCARAAPTDGRTLRPPPVLRSAIAPTTEAAKRPRREVRPGAVLL